MQRMSLRALLLGAAALCCLTGPGLATGDNTTEPSPAAGGTAAPSAQQKEAMDVLLPGLLCSVVARAGKGIYTTLPPCVPDSEVTATDEDSQEGGEDSEEGPEEEEEDEGGRREKRWSNWGRRRRFRYRYRSAFCWFPRWNRQRPSCPRTTQTNVTQGLSGNGTNYPAEEISRLVIVGRTTPSTSFVTPFSELMANAVSPRTIEPDVGSLVVPCPTQRVKLYSYNSTQFNTFCWVVQNLQPDILVNLQCRQDCCSNCTPPQRGLSNLCYPQFQEFAVTAYCPGQTGFPLVSDTITVPVDCRCRSVRCTGNVCPRQRSRQPCWYWGC